MDLNKLSKQQKLAAGSMLVVVIAAFLPWVSIFGLSVSGIKGDGRITLVCGLAGLAVLALASGVVSGPDVSDQVALIVSGIGAVITVLVALTDMNDFAAIGLYLTMFAGFAWVAALVWEFTERKKTGSPST